MKKQILLIIISLIMTNCSSSFGDQKLEESEKKIPVRTILLNPQKYIKKYTGTGKVISSQQANLMFEVPGKIKNVFVKTGQVIKTGETIAKLKNDIYKAQFDLAQSALKKSDWDLKNVQDLYIKNAVSEDQLLEAELGQKNANSNFVIAENAFEGTEIKAPFDGTITHINLQEGEFFTLGPSPIPTVIISDLNQLQLETTIASKDISNIKSGQRVNLTQPLHGKSISLNGIVDEVGLIPINLSNSYKVKIDLINSPNEIKLGMILNFSIEQAQSDSVYLLSNRYILDDNGGSFIWMNDHSIAKKVPVFTGDLVGHQFVINGNLFPGMMVITDGTRQVKAGSILKVIK